MTILSALETGADVVVQHARDDAWVVDQARTLAGGEGVGLGQGPVVVLGGSLPRLRRIESALRAGLTRVFAVRTGADPLSTPPANTDIVVVQQRYLPLFSLARARAWIVLDDVMLAGHAPQVAALYERQCAPTVCLSSNPAESIHALGLFQPTFVAATSAPAEVGRVRDPLVRARLKPAPASDDVAAAVEAAAQEAVARSLVSVGEPAQQRFALHSGSSGKGSARLAPEEALSLSPEQAVLYEALRTWRAGVARAGGLPAYRVFTNRQLQALAVVKPKTREEFLSVPGVGDRAWAQYGAAFLEQLSAVS
jgi:copper(I)-binding protein